MSTTPSPSQDRAVESPRTLLINSAVAAVLGTGLMVLVHEFVHTFTGLALGFPGVQYAFGVDHLGSPAPVQMGIMAISAPVFSLVSGAIMAAWTPLRRRGGFGHLLWLWFAFTSLMEGVGYLVITPFGAGDTAMAVESFGWPIWVAFVMCGLGVALQFGTAWAFAPHVGRHAGTETARRYAFTLWPWIVASVVNVALSLLYLSLAASDPGEGAAFAIVAAATATTVFAPMSFIFARRFAQPLEPLGLKPVPWVGVAAFAVLVALNLAMSPGLRIG